MVQQIFNLMKDSSSQNGWVIQSTKTTDPNTGDYKILPLPDCIYNSLKGKYMSAEEMAKRIKTMQIAVAGVTDSLNTVDIYSFLNRSVLKSFTINPTNSVDQNIDIVSAYDDGYEIGIRNYEKYHIVKMGRDVPGNDKTIHAYIETPKDGKLRCTFAKQGDVRLDAKRNNIDYWLEDYTIDAGSQGGKFVRPTSQAIEIL